MPVKKKVAPKPKKEIIKHNCLICGEEKKDTEFFMSKWSRVWRQSGQRVLFCKECLNQLLTEYSNRYGEELALAMVLHYLDLPFHASLYRSTCEANSIFNIGMYIRLIQMQQYQNSTFINTLASKELDKTSKEVKDEMESRWSKKDRQNMEYSISTIGYDPFEDINMTQNDRKYCFNILAGYLDIEGIREDGHKMQSVVQIAQMQLQCKKLDELINQELLNIQVDESKVKNLTATKKQLVDSTSKLAQDNNISSNYNKNSSEGKNTFSNKMKEILADGVDNMKVNLFDIKTCEAMRQIEDISNRSIIEQIGLDENDYTEMIKEQREKLLAYDTKLAEAVEENRNLKNKMIDLEKRKK